jgi:hypothetical protein
MPSVEYVREMQRIEAHFALDPNWAETHPHEAESLRAQEALAKFLIGVKPPETPKDPGTPKYRALKAYTEYNEKLLDLHTAPDYESFDHGTMKFPSDQTNQKSDELTEFLHGLVNERRTNTAFESAYTSLGDIGVTAYRAELNSLPASASDDRANEAQARTNEIFRTALDNIDKLGAPTHYPHTMPEHGARIVDEGNFSITGVQQTRGEQILLSSPKATLKISTQPQSNVFNLRVILS